MKKVWVTAFSKDQERVTKLLGALRGYGLEADGHFWVDDLEQCAWLGAREPLTDENCGLWVILANADELASETVRYGLSVLTLSVQAQRGMGFPIFIVADDGDLDAESLPAPLAAATVFGPEANVAVKATAKANMPIPKSSPEFFLDVHAFPKIGYWFEVGPKPGETWNGALLGCDSGEVGSHAVGPRGKVPEKSVVEYPMKGVKLELGEHEFEAWAVQNELTEELSYYVGIKETPQTIVFGALPEGEEADLHVLRLA